MAVSLSAVLLALAVAAEGGFTVALDPGHGGSNLGAATRTAGLFEKHVTLDLARRIKRQLARDKGIRVVLCRERDAFVPVRARVRCGNEAGADLFLSLHANASPEGPARGTQQGFELYVLPVADADQDAAVAAASARDDAEAVWAARRVRASVALAVDAGRRLAWRLGDALGTEKDRGLKQEGAFLTSEEGRERVAAALARGITDVRARKVRGQTDPAITSGAAGRAGPAPAE